MNRREALKKLGAGSAVVVGATAVRAVPAFAFNAPTATSAMSLTFTGQVTDLGVNVGFTFNFKTGRATCGASSTSTAPNFSAITDTNGYSPANRAHLSVVDDVGGTYEWGSGSIADGSSVGYSLNTTSGHTVQVIEPNSNPQNGDTIQIYGIVGFRCDYTAPDPDVSTTTILEAELCVQYLSGSWTPVACTAP